MQNFIDFIIKYKNIIVFCALIILSFALISLDYSNKLRGFRALVISTIPHFQSLFKWIPNPTALKNENQALRELNLELSTELTKLRNLIIEDQKLKIISQFRAVSQKDFIPADVIAFNTIEMRNYLTINKGTKQGIIEGMSVRSDAGLVGTIVLASANYSIVETIKNRNVKIPAKNQRNNYKGIVVWEGDDNVNLKNIPKFYDFKVNDVILTTSESNKYPDNIPIGKVIEVKEEPGDQFLKVIVKPYADISSIQQVFVIKELPNVERIQLIKMLEEKIKTK